MLPCDVSMIDIYIVIFDKCQVDSIWTYYYIVTYNML